MFFNADQIRKLKAAIDSISIFPYKYFVTFTWEPKATSFMFTKLDREYGDLDKLRERELYDKARRKQIGRFLADVARREKLHFHCFGGLSPVWKNDHWHGIICADGIIEKARTRRAWKWGQQTDFQKYDPDWGMKHIGDPDAGAVRYIFGGHHLLDLYDKTRIFYPHKTACQQGRCKLCEMPKSRIFTNPDESTSLSGLVESQ